MKGSKSRVKNLKQYRSNYDNIFGKRATPKGSEEQPAVEPMIPDNIFRKRAAPKGSEEHKK
jgi:hypothetical protein